MVKKADITFENNILFILGDINFFNVTFLYEKSLIYLKKSTLMHVDFSKLQSSNSAGIALVIEWMKLAKEQNKLIKFSNFHDDLKSIAKTAKLEGLIHSF